MQDGNDYGSRSKGAEEPKTGVPPVVGHRERDNTVVITHTAEDAHAEQPAGGNSTDFAREQGGPDERLKKIARKQSFEIAGIVLFFYGLYSLIGVAVMSLPGAF